MAARLALVLAALSVLGLLLWDRDRLTDQLVEARAQVQTLQGAVEAQNTAILDLQTQADLSAARATAAARAALLAGERRRQRLPTGHGPAAMNAWLREAFP